MDNIYEIIIEKKAKKFLKKQDIATQRRIIAAIRDLPPHKSIKNHKRIFAPTTTQFKEKQEYSENSAH